LHGDGKKYSLSSIQEERARVRRSFAIDTIVFAIKETNISPPPLPLT